AADYFQKIDSNSSIIDALRRDLPRFLPQNIFSIYQDEDFSDFIATLKEVTSDLSDQGMKKYFEDYGRRKINP
ncbi:MAG: hypothetical protein Q8N82_06255, partial [Deltaproteobacteria bacterium]|nr:hypothetical protein [Deltaproteobacteria bacterium]